MRMAWSLDRASDSGSAMSLLRAGAASLTDSGVVRGGTSGAAADVSSSAAIRDDLNIEGPPWQCGQPIPRRAALQLALDRGHRSSQSGAIGNDLVIAGR